MNTSLMKIRNCVAGWLKWKMRLQHRLSIHLLPPYLQGDNYILFATDISDLKRKELELTEIIGKLVNHIKALRALRCDNIHETLDVEGRKN